MNKYEFLEYINTQAQGSDFPSEDALEVFLSNNFDTVTQIDEGFRLKAQTLYRLNASAVVFYGVTDSDGDEHIIHYLADHPDSSTNKHYIYAGEFVSVSGQDALNQSLYLKTGFERLFVFDTLKVLLGGLSSVVSIIANIRAEIANDILYNMTNSFAKIPVYWMAEISPALWRAYNELTFLDDPTLEGFVSRCLTLVNRMQEEFVANNVYLKFTPSATFEHPYDSIAEGDLLAALITANSPWQFFKVMGHVELLEGSDEDITNLDTSDRFFQADDTHITRVDGIVTGDGNWLQVKRTISFSGADVRKWLDTIYTQIETPWLDENFEYIDRKSKEYNSSYNRNLKGSYKDFYKNKKLSYFGADNRTPYARMIDPQYMGNEFHQHALFSLFRSTVRPPESLSLTNIETNMGGGIETANYKIFDGYLHTDAQWSDIDSDIYNDTKQAYYNAVDNWNTMAPGVSYTCFYPLTAAAISNDVSPSLNTTFSGLTNSLTIRQYQKIARMFPNSDVLSEVYSKVPFVIVSQFEDSMITTSTKPIAFIGSHNWYRPNTLRPQAVNNGIVTKFLRTTSPGVVDEIESVQLSDVTPVNQTRQNVNIVQYQIPLLQSVANTIIPNIFRQTSKKYQDGDDRNAYYNIDAQLEQFAYLTYFRKFVNVMNLPGLPVFDDSFTYDEEEPTQIKIFTVRYYDGNTLKNFEEVEQNQYATVYTIADPVKTFIGWQYENGTRFTYSTPITRNIDLFAIWEGDEPVSTSWTVTFLENGGTEVPDQTVPDGGYAYSPISTYQNRILLGWSLNGSRFNFRTPIHSDITLVAVWAGLDPEPTPTPDPEISWNLPEDQDWDPETKWVLAPDPIPWPDVSMINGGGIYVMTNPEPFYAWLWSTDIVDMIKANILGSPLDAVLGLHYIPFAVDNFGPGFIEANIDAGFLHSDISSRKLVGPAGQFQTLEWSAVSLSTDWYDYRLQGSNAKATLYLPYVGFVDLSVDDVMNSTISLKCVVDIVTGSLTYGVMIDKLSVTAPAIKDMIGTNPAYLFSGNCAYNLPVTAGSLSSIIGSLASVATGAIGGLVVGGGPIGAAVGAAGGLVATATTQHNTTSSKGSYSQNTGITAPQTPYLIIEYGHPIDVAGQAEMMGLPALFTETLSNLSGFVKVTEVDLGGIPCTKGEADEIETALKDGVYL